MAGCGQTEPRYNPMVAVGYAHAVELKSDGTVVAVGRNDNGQCDVGGWTDIVQVAAGDWHTVGLKSDGTVVSVGGCIGYEKCDVGGWTGIVQVAAGQDHTVGLKYDGTVVAVGRNFYGKCAVGNWTDIVQVAAGQDHTVGLKYDGTVVAVGYNDYRQCNVDSWKDITKDPSIENVIWVLESYGEYGNLKPVLKYTFYIRPVLIYADPFPPRQVEITATFDGGNISGRGGCNWHGGFYELKGNNISITKVYQQMMWCGEWINKQEGEYLSALRVAESYEIVGEKLLIHCGNRLLVFNVRYNRYGQWGTDGWTDIEQIAAGQYYTVGVKSDGTVVAVGDWEYNEPKRTRRIVSAAVEMIFLAWWPWITIVVAAVVGLVIFFVRRKKVARTKGC